MTSLAGIEKDSSGVCGLWPIAEPSQNKRKRARSLIVGRSIIQ